MSDLGNKKGVDAKYHKTNWWFTWGSILYYIVNQPINTNSQRPSMLIGDLLYLLCRCAAVAAAAAEICMCCEGRAAKISSGFCSSCGVTVNEGCGYLSIYIYMRGYILYDVQ